MAQMFPGGKSPAHKTQWMGMETERLWEVLQEGESSFS